jgi:Na+/melibiose symporter-like transporter
VAIIAFAISLLFPALLNVLPENAQNAVLLNAIPFFAAFVGVLLLFILLIVLVALHYNGRVPARCYQGVEYTIIAAILGGVVCLFQWQDFIPYRYGFPLLLLATLAFILWSHVVPANSRLSANLRPLNQKNQLIGLLAGLVVGLIIAASIIGANAPKAPYGLRERVWNTYTAERQAEVAAEASSRFNTVEVFFISLLSLFPAVAVYFVAREALAGSPPSTPAAAD